MNEFFSAFLITLNIGSFMYYGFDKRKAQKRQHRISEKSLLIMTLFGGTIGSVLGMLIFNHKTAKKSFIVKMVIIVFIQIYVLYLIDIYYP